MGFKLLRYVLPQAFIKDLYNQIRRAVTEEVTKSIKHAQRVPDADEAQVEDQHVESKGY
jgi:hypothetical protein